MKRFIALTLALLMLMSLLSALAATPPCKHNWVISKVISEPTCTKTGLRCEVCTKCGLDREVVLPALGHEFSQQVYTSYADCTHYGVFYWVCERCGAHSGTGNDKPLGHDWDDGVMTKEPTETDEGEITYTCKRDPSHTKTEPIPCHTASEPDGNSPALSLSMTWDDTIWFDLREAPGVIRYKIQTTNTITNTGNVTLEVSEFYFSHGEILEGWVSSGQTITLAPGESYIANNWHYDGYCVGEYYVYWGKIIDNEQNSFVFTPEDPLYEGYATVTVWYQGRAEGDYDTSLLGGEVLCKSNSCTAIARLPREGAGEEPLGIKVMKTEAHGPANGKYYELGETIDYIITLTNDSGSNLSNLAVYDSLAGFEPIATAESFAQGETLKFEYSTVVTDEEITKAQAVNSAVITFTYGDSASATPRFSNWVYSKAGNTETPETVHFDKAKLNVVPEFSSDAETAEQWNAEAEKLYAVLWEAGDDMAKCAVLEERAMFYSYLEAVNDGLSSDAVTFRQLRAEALYERLMGLAGAGDIEETASDATGEQAGSELIAEELRLKCISLRALINSLQ